MKTPDVAVCFKTVNCFYGVSTGSFIQLHTHRLKTPPPTQPALIGSFPSLLFPIRSLSGSPIVQGIRQMRSWKSLKSAEENCRQMKDFRELCARRAPMFWIPLRAHCVWERMSVTLTCTLGKITRITAAAFPAVLCKYQITKDCFPFKFSLIYRCSLEDSADYSVVVTNAFGQATSFANVLVKGEYVINALLPVYEGHFTSVMRPVFTREKESFTLSSSVSTSLERHGPSIQWFRDGVLLKESDRRKLSCIGCDVSLSGSPAYKEDEGLYTVVVASSSGLQEQSAYMFVKDAEPENIGAPGAPLCVRCHDIHKDCLLLSWTPPSDDRGSPVCGYYVERWDKSSNQWICCNEKPTKICRFPVSGLTEGETYRFRVKAVNQAGVSLPSKATKELRMTDHRKEERELVIPYDDQRKIVVDKADMEDIVDVPLPPTNVHASEISEDFIVLSWDEPKPRGKEPLTYYIQRSIAGSNSWQRIHLEKPVNSPRLPVFDLEKGKSYCFRVQAVNKYGLSDQSEPSGPISLQATLDVPPAPDHILALRDTKTSAVVQWGKVDCDPEILGYYIYSRLSGDSDWKSVNNKPLKCNRFTVPELETGKDYEFCVRAVNEAGLGAMSPISEPLNINEAIYCPSAPYDFTLLCCGKDEMTIGWKAPKFTAGKEILGYFLDQHDSSELNWKDVNNEPISKRVCKVTGLTEGHFYEFRGRAMNSAGVGKMSEPSGLFKCEEWTMAEPGPPYDARCTEVRNTSLMLHWEAPIYEGCSAITGYLVEAQKEGSDGWKNVNENPISECHLRISDLETGKSYQFRVTAVNSDGAGGPSVPCDPVVAATKPGTNEIEVGVDDEGLIFLSFENPEPTDNPKFIWSKDYKGAPDPEKTEISTEGNTSKLVLTNPSMEDVGTYSVEVPNTDGISASHTLTEEELADLMKKSHDVQHPLIKLISDWKKEVLENGDVRLWLQVEKLSPAAELDMILNDKIIENTPKRKIQFDRESGLIEIVKQDFGEEDKGTYTAKVVDGKASNQFNLTLVGEETTLTWSLDKKSIPNGQYDCQSGDGNLTIEKVNDHLHCNLNSCMLSLSASQLKCQGTAEGIKIYSDVKYFIEDMNPTWYHKNKKLDSTDRIKSGSTMNQIWLHIIGPTDTDKGLYTLEIFDGKDTHKRTLDLSGKGNQNIYSDRAKVVRGLPDLATIMVDKTLCLTCHISGDPAPEVSWVKNDKKVVFKDRYTLDVKGTVVTMTIEKICAEDSGRYSITVKNKYGSEVGQVTVSVFKHGEEPEELKKSVEKSPKQK
uniref:Myomesin 3 n=1 Tax=Leptobrachium leishanense TaxID=445787 RepID=A0A8C5MXJ4_9ANUR